MIIMILGNSAKGWNVAILIILGVMVGFILTVSNYCFFTSLMLFFFAGSKVTKFRSKEKRILEEDFKEGQKSFSLFIMFMTLKRQFNDLKYMYLENN